MHVNVATQVTPKKRFSMTTGVLKFYDILFAFIAFKKNEVRLHEKHFSKGQSQ
mgnify:CR=1 FL=1